MHAVQRQRLPLSRQAARSAQQQIALENLDHALDQCDSAGLVFIRRNGNLYAFDEDRLFAAGWTEEADLDEYLNRLGSLEINTRGLIIRIILEQDRPRQRGNGA